MPDEGTVIEHRPSVLQVLIAPWLHAFRPRAAVEIALRARVWTLCVSIVLCVLIAGGLSLFLTTLNYTEYLSQAYRDDAAGPGTREYVCTVEARSLSDAWSQIDSSLYIVAALGPVVPILAIILIVTWLQIPYAYPFDSRAEAVARALRGVCGAAGFVVLLVTVVGICAMVSARLYNHGMAHASPDSWWAPGWLASTLGWARIPAVAFGAIRLRRMVRLACPMIPPECDPPPRCEGCGYDLRHRPTGGRCTECALDLDQSLVAKRARPGPAWERRPSPLSWLEASLRILFQPRSFFRRVPMRTTDDRSWLFASCHLAVFGLVEGAVVFVWEGLSSRAFGAGYWDLNLLWYSAGLSGLICWFCLRLLAFVLHRYEAIRKYVPDARWMRKIVDYHAAYLWPIGLANLLVTLVLSRLLGTFPLGAPVTLLSPWTLYVAVNAILLVLLVWRIRIARVAVRWSNF